MSEKTGLPDEFVDINEIDKLIHEPARLNIMAHLYVIESADFTFLMNQTGLTRGNLSSHMSKLEEAGYLEVEKKFVRKKPQTMLKLAQKGRDAFKSYMRNIKQFMNDLPE